MKADPDPSWASEVDPRPIFFDPNHRRVWMIFYVSLVFLLVLTGWFAEFFLRISNLPRLPDPASFAASAQTGQSSSTQRATNVIMMREGASTDCGQFDLFPGERTKQYSGYLPYRDETALSGLRANCNDIEDLYFEAFVFGGIHGGAIQPLGAEAGSFPLVEFRENWMGRNKPTSYALISPVDWAKTEDVSNFLAGSESQIFESSLTEVSVSADVKGVCLDLSQHPYVDPNALKNVLAILLENSPTESNFTCLLAPIDAPFWRDPDIIARLDRAVVTLPSVGIEVAATNEPLSEIRGKLEEIARAVPAEKLQLVFGAQGTILISGERNAQPISFAEAMHNTSVYGGVFGYAEDVGAFSIRYTDETPAFNTLWMPDIMTWLNALASPQSHAPPVIWPLGYEDPSIWDREAQQSNSERDVSEVLDLGSFAVFTGAGPFSSLVTEAEIAHRATIKSELGDTEYSTGFSNLPRPNHVNFFGLEPTEFNLSVVMIGLPAASQTKDLVDAFSTLGLKVVFFASLRDLLGKGDTITQLVDAGHQIGISLQPSSYQSLLSRQNAHLGRNLVQNLLAYDMGLQARFVLALGATDRIPDTLPRLDQMRDLQASGLFVVHSSIEANIADLDMESFIERVYDHALARSTNVISFDINRANSQEMLKELPRVVERLRSDGFEFFTLNALAGITTSEALPPAEVAAVKRDGLTYSAMSVTWLGVQGTILLLALIVALRSPVYLFLALLRRKGPSIDPGYHPPITLIVPAFNEEKVIRRTLQSVIECDYPDMQIIVVDDGSSDDTASVVEAHFHDVPNLTLVRQKNRGKWSAINHAIMLSDTPFFCILDADSLLEKTAISQIVQPFKDARVGAVSGTIEIGNSRNLLTAFQVLEYMTTQQVMRRAYEVFDGIIVVPGALGAWRTEAVIAADLVSGETITEDADLTIAVHRQDYTVRYQADAKSYTEAPLKIRDFLRQRFRWTFGMIQVSWKHKKAVSELRPVGFISLVDAIWYNLVTSMIYPIIDLIIIVAAINLGYAYLTTGSFVGVAFPPLVAVAYFLSIFMDLLNIFVSMAFAKRFNFKLFLLAPLMGFGYRQLLYISTLRAIFAALFGSAMTWNKMDRSDTTRLPKPGD